MSTTQEQEVVTGARPLDRPGADAVAAAASVQGMFDSIAPRYDVLNHVLSVGIDFSWWWRAARTMRPTLRRPEAQVVDLCCGTGDMTRAMLRHRPSTTLTAPILAVDFSHQMLSLGKHKLSDDNALAIEADALHLALRNNSADLISAAFGFRNLVSYEDGLAELFRVLKPGGEIAILECNQPSGLVAGFYNLYFKIVLPRVGGMLSNRMAYTYLPASVERFPRAPRMLELIRNAGFESATWTSYTLGIAGLYRATKPLGSR